ncbi:MAG: hypothetical protein WCJ30_04750 [Deltaproteobacteria bacterium]
MPPRHSPRPRPAAPSLLLAITLALAGCQSTVACVPDGTPACECAPGDSRDCTDDAGFAGLEACGMNGRWTACGTFGDASVPRDARPDAVFFDFGPRD